MYTHNVLLFLDSSSIAGIHYTSNYSGILSQLEKVERATAYSYRCKNIVIKLCNTLSIPITFTKWDNYTSTVIDYIIMISKLKKT